jgi:hypothetical protein
MAADGYLIWRINPAGAADEHIPAQRLESNLLELLIGIIRI